ncbi:MAG: TolC family protein [Betaproteobacteria bacterium]
MPERLRPMLVVVLAGLALAPARPLAAQEPPAAAAAAAAAPAGPPAAAPPRVTFAEAVKRALDRHPTVGQAVQAVRRAQALLDQSRAVFRPLVTGFVGETILDAARGFGDSIVQPQKQTSLSGTVSFPLLAASRWAATKHAADQVEIARISAQDARRQVAFTAAQAYLAVLAAQHQRLIALHNRENARALADYARTRLEAGQGSRLNHVRASQELATVEGLVYSAELAAEQAREALGVAIFADGPMDADGDPEIEAPAPPAEDEARLQQRPDLRLFSAQAEAAERVVQDNWKSWLPTASASFTPQYVTPKGLFQPARTWVAFFQLQVPIFDGTLGSTRKLLIADRETARLRLQAVQTEARAEVRSARQAVQQNERIAAAMREAAASAVDALQITEVAYRAGATTNVEVVQAQQTARNAEILAALAQDQLLRARLGLLVALGEFP